jgi:putative transcriptional regulator
MKEELFNELVESVRESGKILRGNAKPSRTFVIETPNVKKIRAVYKLSQNKFAALKRKDIAQLGTRTTRTRRRGTGVASSCSEAS